MTTLQTHRVGQASSLPIDQQPGKAAPQSGSLEETAELQKLAGAFELFNRRSEKIEQAYQALKLRVAQVDAELEDANKLLRAKVTELDHVQGHLRNILQSMADGVLAVDTDGIITIFNRAAGRILDIDPEDAIGEHCKMVLHSADESPLILLETLRTGESFNDRRHELTSPLSNTRRIVESTTSQIRDTDGEVQGAVEVFRDRTEIEDLKRRLFRSDRLAQIGEATAGLAHEIRNPLGGIEGFAALMQRSLDKDISDADGERLKRLAGNIADGVRSLNCTVTSMLDFCRDTPARLRTIRLSSIFHSLLEALRIEHCSGPDIEVITDFQTDEIEADPQMLRQTFLNLIANAMRSMENGGRLTITSRPVDQQPGKAAPHSVRIEITDTGSGIDPALLPHLFEPFVTGRTDGTGLGLAIVKKIIREHGGEVSVSSVTESAGSGEHGTTFTVTLPVHSSIRGKTQR